MKEEVKEFIKNKRIERKSSILKDTKDMFVMKSDGMTVREIGKKFGISGTAVWYRLSDYEYNLFQMGYPKEEKKGKNVWIWLSPELGHWKIK